MSGSLDVHLNRGDLHAVEPATDSYRSTGSFDVRLVNDGGAVHVHLKLAGPLSAVADLAETNYFVDTESTEAVRVSVDPSALPVEGRLEIVTGYGRQRAEVDVGLVDPEAERAVAVDDSLASPPNQSADEGGLAAALAREGPLRLVGLALLAVVLAAVAVSQASSPVVGLGVLAVFLGIGVAGYLVAR